jgi:transmembrane sensor
MKLKVNRNISTLLVKNQLGEATQEEKEEVTRWMAADPSHKMYADELHEMWKDSGRLAPPVLPDATAAWQRFQQSGKIPAKTNAGYPWRAVAAVLFFVAAGIGSWWALAIKHTGTAVSISTQSTVRTDTLPDGSRVTLNKYSSLVLRGKGSRIARLTGEAFFQVVHKPDRPFTVEVGSATIQDVGTSFNVRSLNDATEVIVEDGAILVTDGTFTVKASAGERVLIAAGHGGISKTTAGDQLYQYYRTKKFVCHKTPLPEFVAALNTAYGVNIVLQGDAVRNLLLTTTFDNDDLNSILSVVTRTLGLIAQRKGEVIILKQN